MPTKPATPKEIVSAIAERVAVRLGLELDHVEVSTHPKNSFIRVYLDKEGGVSLEDCQKASAEIGTILDVEDPMPGHYTLEVSSPGLDRPLRGERDYERYRGRAVRIHTYAPFEGRRDFIGKLLGLEDGVVRVEDKDLAAVVEVPLAQIAKARLEVEF